MIENLPKKLNDLKEKVEHIKKVLNFSDKKKNLDELNLLMSANGFWDDNDKAIKISQEAEGLNSEINLFIFFEKEINEISDLITLAGEYSDGSMDEEIDKRFLSVERKFSDLEFLLLFSEQHDNSSAILSIHAGVGGVDACDWAQMLERMYLRFAEKKGFKVEILDRISANEAGIKTSVLKISGLYAFGYFKGENGVHRLVRISPFDAENMRHTSFAGVEVVPEIKEDLIPLSDKDLRIDVYRSSGPGGQSVNTTDSAVRVVHIPSGLSAACQSERSQHQNKEKALEILRAKLYQLQKDGIEASVKEMKGSAGQGTWGKQIRSYVFQPYQMVKDHRNNYSVNTVDDIMDGNLDNFVEEYLRYLLKNRNN